MTWCLPGGHVEAGETFEAAATREIAEESGVERVREATVFGVAHNTGANRTSITIGVTARVAGVGPVATTPEANTFDQWVWVPPEELPAPLFEASAALLAAWQSHPLPAGWNFYPSTPRLDG